MNRAFELMMSGALLVSPIFFRRSQRRLAAIPVALGAVGFIRCFIPKHDERRTFHPSRELAEAVADPDNARGPSFRTYVG